MDLLKDVTLLLFTGFNAIRVVGYFPQIIKVYRDVGGASAVSITTWTVFTLSHLSTAAYAVLCVSDLYMATVFVVNACCCAVIALLTRLKRTNFHRSGIVQAESATRPATV